MPESEILVRYKTDERSLQRTIKGGKELNAAQEALVKSSGQLNKTTKAAVPVQNKWERELEQANDALGRAKKEIVEVRKELDAYTRQQEAANKAAAQYKGPSGTEIAGDVAGRSAQVRGALDVFAGGQLGAVGGLLEGVEAVADLREALPLVAQNAKDAISGLSGAGGLTGALSGLVGGAGTAALALGIGAAAIGGVVVAMNALSKESEKQAKLLASTVEATREVNQQIVAGLTSEDAQQRLDELLALREKEKGIYDELKAGQDELNDKFGVTRDVVGLVNKQIPQLNEEIKNSEELMQSYDSEIEALNEALANGALDSNDAKAAEEELATARDDGGVAALQAAQKEQEATRERERQAQEAQRAQEEAAREQQRAIEERQRAAEQAAQRAAQAHTTYANAIDDAGRAARQAAQDTKTKLVDSLRDLSTGYQRQLMDDALKQRESLFDLQQDQFSEEQKAYRDQARAVRDIIKNASRSQKDLLAERDFLALDQLAKQTERELDDQKQATKDEARERDISNREAVSDLRLQSARLRRERQADYSRQQADLRMANQRELRDIQTAKTRQLEQARIALRRELELAQQGIKTKLQLEADYWKQSAALVPGGDSGGAVAGGSMGPANSTAMQTQLLSMLGRVGL